jgi:outer membrane protein TolC
MSNVTIEIARELASLANEKYEASRALYRAGKIDDAQYLEARRVYELVSARYEKALIDGGR